MMRSDIVRLGQGAVRPWDFLPICWQALRVAPGDGGLRLLAAANLARLGLRTLALEELDTLGGGAESAPEVAELRAACEALPEDRVGAEALAAMCSLNLEAARGALRDDDLEACFERWLESVRNDEWFRGLDGNVVRRRGNAGRAGPRADWQWLLFGDHRGAAERFAAQHLASIPGMPAALSSTYTVEGVNPPWLLMQVSAHTPRQKDGFWPRLMVVQADPIEFLDGLACADVREVLSQKRLGIYMGPDGAAKLASDLRQRTSLQLSGPCIPLVSLRKAANAADALAEVQKEQAAEHERLAGEVAAIYQGRDHAWWRRRYAEALDGEGAGCGPGRPLRVLVPTTRYSTYLQHASTDLVEALNAMGLEARLLIEPDDFSKLSSLAYLRQFKEFQPDLVVLINHFRNALASCIPAQVPFVCWIQDAMPHQFDAQAGKAQGELDFLAGHMHPEMFARYGFSREQSLAFPVVVSRSKFHDGAVGGGSQHAERKLRERFECEIALVSHHSETPERMHDRLVQEAGDPGIALLFRELYPRIVAIGEDAMRASQWHRLRSAVSEAISNRAGREATEDEITPIFRQYAMPLGERVLRHQTVRWAAEVALRRGWRLALYGRGWESDENFAEYARGEAKHGEELRAIYQCAAVQLHISATALVHQRVMECALSGGLPICRLTRTEVETIASAARRQALLETEPDACEIATRKLGRRIADHPGLMAMTALMQRMGLAREQGANPGHEAFIWTNPPRPGTLAPENIMALERRADWVFGDLGQVSFQTVDELEAIVERAITQPSWRLAMSRWIAGRVRERLTHERFVGKVLGLVRRSLAKGAKAGKGA